MNLSSHVSTLKVFLTAEDGVTAIEYGLLGALIAVVIVVSLQATSTSLINIYTAWSAAVSAAV
jgi:pilus assembly protein Flp/PilA